MALKSVRFALGTAERPCSGVWHLWVQEDDVHLDVHTAHQPVAFTAFKTGRWRISVGEAMSRWTRPRDFRPGWARGPDLLVPGSARPLPALVIKPTESVSWLDLPGAGHLARFTMLFATPRSTEFPWRPRDLPGTTEVAVLTLRTTGVLYLCRQDEPNDDPEPAGNPAAPPLLTVRISANEAGVPSLRETYGG